jgi:periplasmic mercuric ion binding protein
MRSAFFFIVLNSKNYSMKSLKTILFSFLLISFSTIAVAQAKTEKIKVSGECGMCKSKIEKAAKAAGASYALWDVDNKVLTVKYNNASTNTAKIEKAVATVGYDTEHVTATEEAYNGLHSCCKYDRTVSATEKAHSCCDNEKCKETSCMKDGKCTADMSCCKEAGCSTKDCCKKA